MEVKRGVRQPEWSAGLQNWIIAENRESRIANCESQGNLRHVFLQIHDSQFEIRDSGPFLDTLSGQTI
jgi:hypothetical protein